MQVNSINNYQQNNNPNFTAFVLKPGHNKEFVSYLEKSPVSDLVRILHAVTNQEKNGRNIELMINDNLADVGSWILRLQAKINNKIYAGPSIVKPSTWNLAGFFEYLGIIAERKSPNKVYGEELIKRRRILNEDLEAYKLDIANGKPESDVKNELIGLIKEKLNIAA